MKLEVVEDRDSWIVRRDGEELARFRDQDSALADATWRLRQGVAAGEDVHSFAVRYLERG